MELIDLVNSVIIFRSQTTLFKWLAFLLGGLTVTLTSLLFWIYFFILTLEFVLQWLSLHWKIMIMLLSQLPSYSQRDAPFHRIANDYSRADCDGLRDHLSDTPWEGILKLTAFVAASEFCELVQVGIDVYIPHCKCQVKSHSSSWFSASCTAAIVLNNHFFRL